jgi:hypothetical protein
MQAKVKKKVQQNPPEISVVPVVHFRAIAPDFSDFTRPVEFV